MGKVEWRGDEYAEDLWDSLEDRLSSFADLIEDDARARAPMRQTTPGRKKGRVVAFLPQHTYRFGKVTLKASEIARAATRLNINLGRSAAIRAAKGLGPLRIRERRPDRRVGRGTISTREAVGQPLRGSAFIARIRRIAGETGDTRPGRLKRSIASANTSEGNVIKFTIRAEAPYARYVEFPTSRTAAQPFLLPALKNARQRLKPWLKGRQR